MAGAAVPVEALLARAIEHLNAGRGASAREVCGEASAGHPDHPAVQQLLAVLCMHEGDAGAALVHAEASLATRPGHGPTLVVAGDAARATGALERALAHYAEAHAQQPQHTGLATALADAEHRCGRLSAAARTLLSRIEHAPGDAQAWFQLALVRQDLGDVDGAIEASERTLALAPERVDAAVNLGILLQEAGRVDAAMQAYGRAYMLREDTFGRIAHALAAAPHGRLWLDLDALRTALHAQGGAMSV